MKHILKALDEKLKDLKARVWAYEKTINSYQDTLREYQNEITNLEKKLAACEASRDRIHEKVVKAWEEWNGLKPAILEEHQWLDHLQYIAEHAPEDQ